MAGARYRLLSPSGEASEDGSADVEVTGGALVLAPEAGAVLRVPFAQISGVAEAEQFTLRITVAGGTVIELSRLGVMRTQLLAELRDGRGEDAATAAGAVGDAEIFTGEAGGVPAELRVYDDALLVITSAGSERLSFSFAGPVAAAGYAVRVEVAGRPEPVVLSRLGRRTGEFERLLAGRLREARGRTAAFLGALLPGLDPLAQRQAAGLLRDGVAVPAAALDAIHPELAATLIRLATLPQRRDAVADLGRRGELALGFKQAASVRRPATGVTPWQDHAVTPHIGQHESPGGSFAPGLGGMMAAGMMAAGPPFAGGNGGAGSGMAGWYGGDGPGGFPAGGGFLPGEGYWAFRALGAGLTGGGQHQLTTRADVTRGRLTPATEDLAALTAAGDNPTVLAFALARAGDLVAFEVLNLPGPDTWAYRVRGPDGLAAVNRALDDAGFDPAAAAGGGLGTAARPAAASGLLAASLAGRISHDAQWAARLAALLDR